MPYLMSRLISTTAIMMTENKRARRVKNCKLSLIAIHSGLHSFVEIWSRPFSPFRCFKKGSCQLLAKEWALSTGKLPRRLAQEQCG